METGIKRPISIICQTIFFVLAISCMGLVACTKEDSLPSVEFTRNIFRIYQEGTTEVTLRTSRPTESTLEIPLLFSGEAVPGEDYEVSASTLVIPAGETTGKIIVHNRSLSQQRQIVLDFTVPSGYQAGNRFKAVVSPIDQEAVTAHFIMDRAHLYESAVIGVELWGIRTGKKFKAQEDIRVPLHLEGEGREFLQVGRPAELAGSQLDTGENPEAVLIVPAGSNQGKVQIWCTRSPLQEKLEVTLSVEISADARFLPTEENSQQQLILWGGLHPSQLEGTWEYEEMYDQEELEFWFEAYEDDPALLPTHNEGFQFRIQENGGNYELIPNGKGDFSHFFRKSPLISAEPVNGCANFVVLGAHSLQEQNMFMAAEGYLFTQNWYYRLSTANRSFDASQEKLGPSTICISMIDEDHLQLHLRDYDCPPFGFMWWDDHKFDGEMFGFSSRFKRVGK